MSRDGVIYEGASRSRIVGTFIKPSGSVNNMNFLVSVTLDREILTDHVGIEVGTFALGHHGAFGHHDVLLCKPGGEV